jgi:hypothetical protein
MRNVGYTSGDMETEPEHARLGTERAHKLDLAAGKIMDAHDALIEMAKQCGFDLSALDAPVE